MGKKDSRVYGNRTRQVENSLWHWKWEIPRGGEESVAQVEQLSFVVYDLTMTARILGVQSH